MTDTLTFKKAEIPTNTRSGRTPFHNPFVEAFPADGEALVFEVKEGRNSKEARRALRQIRTAAKMCDRTGRATFKDMPNGAVQITTWTVERIARKTTAKTTAPAKKTASAKK